jgi:membrane-bound serine protease (ClpP class)
MRTLAIASLITGVLLAAAPAPAAPRRTVDVIEVSGRLDPVVADFVTDAVRSAERGHSEALVIQLDSPGSVLSAGQLDVLAFRVSHARIPVTVWIGPSGARAHGGAVRLVRPAAITGIAPGSHVGRFTGRCPLCASDDPLHTKRSLSASQAVRAHAVDNDAPTLGDFIVGMNGHPVPGHPNLSTARQVNPNGRGPRLEPTVNVRFAKLGLLPRLLHTVASPAVAYFLLVAGLTLMVFEFFTVGIGLAGAVGTVAVVLSAYGLAVLPARPGAVALIVVGILGYAVDVQAGAPRLWTVIGTAALVAGSWLLFAGIPVPWLTAVLTIGGVALFMLAAMPATVRARFSTPTIGRASMVGEVGLATADLAPEGMVRVRDALWRARTNRATPIAAGDPVRVAGVEGLVLQVEPAPGENGPTRA